VRFGAPDDPLATIRGYEHVVVCNLLSGAAERPATPVKANKDCCDGTDGSALQQMLQRFSFED